MTLFQRLFYCLLLFFIGILSISGTIALRNVVHVVMLGMFVWALTDPDKRCAVKPSELWREVPWALRGWVVFLFLFPLWAIEGEDAWRELLVHWSESILTWVLAFAAIAILGKSHINLWALTWASAVPVLLHLMLLPLRITGLLQGGFEAEQGLSVLWSTLINLMLHPSTMTLQWQSIIGFRGIEPMHGNIGYPACQTIALALGCLIQARRSGSRRGVMSAWGLIALCLASGLLASSRGTVLFAVLLLLFAALVAPFVHSDRGHGLSSVGAYAEHRAIWQVWVFVVASALLLLALFLNVVRHDVRWQTTISKIELGFMVGNPLKTLCKGVQPIDRERIHQMAQGQGPEYEQELLLGLEGQDGGRVLLQRVGVQIVLENPWGLDGSREAYEKQIKNNCDGHTPVLAFSHAHNAWINLALSTGWLGAVLLASVFVSFALRGWRGLRTPGADAAAGVTLLLLAVFWLVRGIGDAVYQEHYLQMQAIMLLVISFLIGGGNNFKSQGSGLK